MEQGKKVNWSYKYSPFANQTSKMFNATGRTEYQCTYLASIKIVLYT